MNTIIEKIRAEIERQAKSIDTATGDFAEGRRMEQRIILSVLSDLEVEHNVHEKEVKEMLAKIDERALSKLSEKPMELDFEQELYKHFGQIKDFTLGLQIAKHFYELGCRRTAEKYDEIEYKRQRADVCEGLEEEIERYLHSLGVGYGGWVDGMEDDDLRGIARHFAQWQKEKDNEVADKALTTSIKLQEGWYAKGIADGEKSMKEQMMKEAVEVVVWDAGVDFAPHPVISVEDFNVKDGDKVRVIVCKKED